MQSPASADDRDDARRLDLFQSVEGRRVLLFDDTSTSGDTVFAAVDLIERGGGSVVGSLVVGRHVNPDLPPTNVLLDRVPMGPLDLSAARGAGFGIDPALRDNWSF